MSNKNREIWGKKKGLDNLGKKRGAGERRMGFCVCRGVQRKNRRRGEEKAQEVPCTRTL